MQRITTMLCTLSAAMMLGACSPQQQDKGSQGSGNAITGLVVDGYLARAVIYVDTNSNQTLDAWEPRAFTDQDGYFSVSKTGRDYCAADATEDESIYCLNAVLQPQSEVVLRTQGGYDITTNESFNGGLAIKVQTDANGRIVVSPISTLLSYMDSAQQSAFANALGVPEADLQEDFLDFTNTGLDGSRSQLIAAALQAQKVTEVLTSTLSRQYTAFGDEQSLPADTSAMVYQALATQLQNQDNRLDLMLSQSDQIQAVLQLAETNARSKLSEQALTVPAAVASADVVQVAVHGAELTNTVASLFSVSSLSETESLARARAIEVVTAKIRDNPNDSSIDEAVTLATQSSYLSALESTSVDLQTLNSGISDGMNTDDGLALVTQYTVSNNLPDTLVGTKMSGTNNPDSADRGGAVFYFRQGDSVDANSGKLELCLRFDSAKDDTNDTTGARFTGNWTRLNPFTLLINIQLAGSNYSTILKSKRIEPDGSHLFRFDYNDEEGDWTSSSGFVVMAASEQVPADDAACKAVVP